MLHKNKLTIIQVYQRVPKISMLVVGTQANFLKKATGTILFSCEDGLAIQAAINESIATGEGPRMLLKLKWMLVKHFKPWKVLAMV